MCACPAQTYLEDGRFCLTCHFNDVPTKQAHAPFVNHFASCQMCARQACFAVLTQSCGAETTSLPGGTLAVRRCTESIPMRVELGDEAKRWCAAPC